MMPEAMRYAVYYTPGPADGLTAAAAAWLGRDPHTGETCRQPDLDRLPADKLETLTADPRRYGFHGTLKAPFRLGRDVQTADLVKEIEDFAAATAAVTVPDGFKVARLGPFFALVPAEACPDLTALASNCVRRFETFRAPLTDAELERRRRSRLSDHQDSLLTQWGYPYVFDEFRFHMTLTGRVPETLRDAMQAELETYFADYTGRALRLDTLSLFSQAAPDAPFLVQATFPLEGRRPDAQQPVPDQSLA